MVLKSKNARKNKLSPRQSHKRTIELKKEIDININKIRV